MKKIIRLLLDICCALLIFLGGAKFYTVYAASFSPETENLLTEELDSMIKKGPYQVPGLGVIIYRDGKEIYNHFVGFDYINNRNHSYSKHISRNSRFRVASVSKMYTIFTIMQLVEQGKINLDDDVSKYLGFPLRNPSYPKVPITLKMLASHTSSL